MSQTTTNMDLDLTNEIPTKKTITLLVGSAAMGILFNILFYEKTPGISIPLFFTGFYLLFFFLIKEKISFQADIKTMLLLVIILLTSTFALFNNPILMFFNILAIPVLVAAHTILLSGKNTYEWHSFHFIGDLICEGVVGILAYMLKPFSILGTIIGTHKSPQGAKTFTKLLAGIVISLPLVFVVIGLLSSADAVFENVLSNVADLFNYVNLNSFILQFSLILIITLFVFSYLWNLTLARKMNINTSTLRLDTENSLPKGLKLDYVIVTTVLSILCIIYLLFISIQFTYLFSSISVNFKLPTHLTYASYARKGFFELIMVSMLNLSILLTAIHFTKPSESGSFRILKILEVLLVASTIIILFSAHFRMSLYEKVYGYTYLRFFTHAFMLYLFTLLLAVLARILIQKLELSKHLIIISLIAFTMINYVNADKFIAAKNTAAYHKSGKIDVTYLSELSYDGIPYMLDVLTDMKKRYPDSTETKILENHLYFDKTQLAKTNHWQSFNLSASKARKLLKSYPLIYREIPSEYRYMD